MATELPPLGEAAWSKIDAILQQQQRSGRPRSDLRRTVAGVLLVRLAGSGWQRLPSELGFGSGVTCWRRLREWEAQGLWPAVQRVLDGCSGADLAQWAQDCMDSVRNGDAMVAAAVPRTFSAAELRRDGRRRALLAAAVEIMRDSPADAVTVEEVVSRVGVSRPVFYSHFRTRGALIAAIYDEYAAVVLDRTAAVIGPGVTVPALVQKATEAYFDSVEGFGVVIRAVIASESDDPLVRASRHRLREKAVQLYLDHLGPAPGVSVQQLRLGLALTQAMAEEAATQWLSGRVTRQRAQRMQVEASTAVLASIARRRRGRGRELPTARWSSMG